MKQIVRDDGGKYPMTGVILAGGKSRRMGQDKALMKVDGVPVLERILGVLEQLFDEVLIVTDREGRFPGYARCREIVDLLPDCGPLGGIYTGLHFARSGRVFVASCDLPFIRASAVEPIVRMSGDFDIVVPEVDGKLHPLHAVYGRRCKPMIRSRLENRSFSVNDFINNEKGLSVRRVPVHEFQSDDAISFFNMNSEKDWIEANKANK